MFGWGGGGGRTNADMGRTCKYSQELIRGQQEGPESWLHDLTEQSFEAEWVPSYKRWAVHGQKGSKDGCGQVCWQQRGMFYKWEVIICHLVRPNPDQPSVQFFLVAHRAVGLIKTFLTFYELGGRNPIICAAVSECLRLRKCKKTHQRDFRVICSPKPHVDINWQK